MPLETTIERLGAECAVVSIQGGLTLGTNLKTLDSNLQEWISSGVTRLVLDLSDCGYCDSAGLGVLVHAFGFMAQRGGSMRLAHVGSRVMDLLKMTKTDGILPCDPDRASSLAALGCTA